MDQALRRHTRVLAVALLFSTLAGMTLMLGSSSSGPRLLGQDRKSEEPMPALPPSPTAAAQAQADPSPPEPSPMPLDMAVGQMFAASFYGTEITDGLRHLILDDKVGTVLIFRGNFNGPEGLSHLTAGLQDLGRQAGLPAPLLIAVDEEGGRVMRITDGVSALPDALSLGRNGPDQVRRATAATAAGLRDLGIRLNLAPVADLRTNPADAVIGDRSFGSDPKNVGALVAAAVSGLHDSGVAATLKHFPGLGGAAGDPHADIPTDPEARSQWEATQALSFKAGIEAGADAVMTTAVFVPGLDPTGQPALFSREVVTGLLRQRLGFQGVIVADSLSMGGIGARYRLTDATLAAARAGNDLLLLAEGDTSYEQEAIAALRQAVGSGDIPLAQVQDSAARVISLRLRYAERAYFQRSRQVPPPRPSGSHTE
jgi:beta-N-acetylhexosaminidase